MNKATAEKVVAYVVHDDRLLVFTHLTVPLVETGVQVPAGTIRPGETPDAAATREVFEETGLQTSVVRKLGVEAYDLSPTRFEVATRHFFLLRADGATVPERWEGGEDDPATGTVPVRWECWWLPLAQAHVLSGGLGAMIGSMYE